MTCANLSYRNALPQLGAQPFLTDGGLETTLTYHEDWDLPAFAAFVLLDSSSGVASLQRYYERYIRLAVDYHCGLILESPTWRAGLRWGTEIGYSPQELEDVNLRAILQLAQLRNRFATAATPMVISGCLGPHDDGYAPATQLSVSQAKQYHSFQAEVFARTDADMLCAVTFTYVEEAIGATQAAVNVGMPIAISFTVETDGKLPSGHSIQEAVREVDQATDNAPAYYMINCAHPSHFQQEFSGQGQWLQRIAGIRANASCKSHSELDEALQLDEGDPHELGRLYRELKATLPQLNVLGGCCGTDHRHIGAIAQHCLD